MPKKRKSLANHGIPALVCVTTGETVTIDGKRYHKVKLMYDLKGEYIPLAQPIYR